MLEHTSQGNIGQRSHLTGNPESERRIGISIKAAFNHI